MNEDDSILIEKYIAKQMTTAEAQDFEKRLASDEVLMNDYKATLDANEIIKEAGRIDLKKTMTSFETKRGSNSEEKNIIPLWVKRTLPLAAILIALIAVNPFNIFNKSVSSSEVFSDFFEPYNAPGSLRDVTEILQPNWDASIQRYREGRYQIALDSLSSLETNVPRYLIYFYAGNSAMAKENPDYALAIKYFDLVRGSDNDYREQANWYKGLALLKMNRRDDASAIFRSIVDNKAFNHEKAKAILKNKWED